MNRPASPPLPPPVVPDHELVRCIGRGSYGEVWLARNVIGAWRAVKIVFRRSFDHDRPYEREFEGIRRFEPVSRSHEGFVNVLQIGRNDSEGHFYYVMELADDLASKTTFFRRDAPGAQEPAGSLNPDTYEPKTLGAKTLRGQRLSVEDAGQIGLALTSALEHLHNHGLVHRDIKPANIIFVRGLPKLADIGLVAELGAEKSFVGTEGFTPPEGPGTLQSDLFSLGKVLYEISTGRDRLDFPTVSAEPLPPDERERFSELNEVILKACAQRPADRYESAAQMHADLAVLRTGRSVRKLRKIERRLAFMTRLGVGALVVTVFALGGTAFFRRQAARDRQNLQRLEQAEREARRQLWNSLVAQSRAQRGGRTAGHRFASLELVHRAGELGPVGNPLTLRNEVIASLATADLRSARLWTTPWVTNDLSLLDLEHDRVFAISKEGRVWVHSLNSYGPPVELPSPEAAVRHFFHVSPDGRHLAALDRKNHIRVWNAEEQKPTSSYPMGTDRCGARFTPDGQRLVLFNGVTGEFAVHALSMAARSHSVQGPTFSGPVGLRLSPDGRQAALGSTTSNTVFIVDTETGATRHSLELPLGLTAFEWQPNGPLLATSCDDRKVRVWNTRTGRLHAVLTGHSGLVVGLAFDQSGEFLASSSYDGTTRLWNLHTGEAVASLPQAGIQLRFDRAGRRLALIPWAAHEVQLCDVATERVCRRLPPAQSPFETAEQERPSWGVSADVRSTQDECWLATGGNDGLRLWEAASMRLVAHTNLGYTTTVEFERGDKGVIAVGERGVWRWPLLHNAAVGPALGEPERLAGAQRDSRAVWSADGKMFAWVAGRRAFVRDASGTEHQLSGRKPLTQIAISPDGHWLATAAFSEGGATIWNLDDLETPAREISTRVGPSLAFTPNGVWLVVGTDQEYGLWDHHTGQRQFAIPRADTAGISGPMAFSPDGRTMAIAATRTLIRLVEWNTGRELATLESATPAPIGRLNFSAQGTRLAASIGDGVVEIWELKVLRHELAARQLDWE